MLLATRGDLTAAGRAWRAALVMFRELGMPEAAEVAARLAEPPTLQPDALRRARPVQGGAAEEPVEHPQRRRAGRPA
jgi:hypothetical protein